MAINSEPKVQFNSNNKHFKAETLLFFYSAIILFLMIEQNFAIQTVNPLTAHNWQKWKRVFLTCPCHKIYRDEAVGLKSCKYT